MGKDILYRVGNGGCCGCETVSCEVLPQVEIPEKWTQEPPCFVITIGVRLRSHTNKEDNQKKIYINEDLTKYRAQLFKTTRNLQTKKYFKQAWAYNGNIKVTTQNGVINSISTIHDIKSLSTEVYLPGLIWMIIMCTHPNI